MTPNTVAVTGGNGWLGEAIVRHLNENDYNTVSLSRGKARNDAADRYLSTDLLDAGQVYAALASCEADAVVHMGTLASPKTHPGYVTYESNVLTTYHVLEASMELGIDRVCLASSINAMGASFQDDPIEVDYLPVDEDHRLTPRDPYAMSKHALEVTADGFARWDRGPTTISSLRYPWVAGDDQLRERFAETDRSLATLRDPETFQTKNVLFAYLHVADAAMVARLAIEADFDGHERFWAVANDTNADVETEYLVAEFYPDAEQRNSWSGFESIVSTEKARELLGWVPERSWRDL